MAILPVRLFGDPVLRQEARAVENFDEHLHALAANMMETMKAYQGLGLAGNQVGVLQRIFTWEEPDLQAEGAVVNPVVEWASEEMQEGDEGCLSFPGHTVSRLKNRSRFRKTSAPILLWRSTNAPRRTITATTFQP